MGDSNDLRNFELIMKKNTAKRPPALYNTTSNNNTTIKPQDVLDSVYSQIKMMQLADGGSSKIGKNMKGEKSGFMAVSKLPVYHEASKQTNTFETQCVSDTQLINFIEDAEALINTHKGMTQEFDTDFTQNTVTMSQDETDKENMIVRQEFETTFTQTNVDKTVSFLHDKSERDASDANDNDKIQIDDRELTRNENHKNIDLLRHDQVIEEDKCPATLLHIVKIHIEKCCTNEWSMDKNPGDINEDSVNNETESEMSDREKANSTIMHIDAMEIEEERSPSPVLKVKTKSKMITKSLVVPLESFERFERIAIPVIDSNNDFDTCKHLINSQILGGELCLNTDEDLMFHDNGQLSPIMKQSCSIIQNNVEDNTIIRNNIVTNLENIKELKDEILFSSDEENDFIYREFQDMPLTAALETSFYDHSDVLEETMYVGFQTASNKSIQIGTNSFQKARFILDEDDNINGKDFSLAALVEICDEKSIIISSADLKVQEKPKDKGEEGILVANEESDKSQIKLNDDINKDEKMIEDPKENVPKVMDFSDTIKKPPEKQSFVGFKTASNKKIDLSDKTLNVGKKVFQDIDFDEEFDSVDHNNLVDEESKVKAKDNILAKLDVNVIESDIDDKINDDLIIQEFENIEMSLEEKEKYHGENNITPILGFKTASNRNIDISDAAKVKIKNVIQDIDLGEIDETEELNGVIDKYKEKLPHELSSEKNEKKDYPEITFIGFKTANNKNISISAQALSNTKNIFQDIDTDIDTSIEKLELKKEIKALDYHKPSTSKTSFVGFKTANNKDIRISEVALSKSSKIFQDIEKFNQDDIENEADPKTQCKGFKTASNKNVNISEQALQKSRQIFQDMEEGNEKNIEDLNQNHKDNTHFSGFKTANDKAVAISEESIAESKKLFKDFDTNFNQNESIQALEISKNIFQDIDVKNVNITSIAPDSNFKELQKASNKEVAISEETLEAKNSFGICEDFEMATFVGFKTASNKKVDVSGEALAKCKKIFEDLDDLPTKNNKPNDIPKSTANHKPFEDSKDALERRESIFNDIGIPEVKETFSGFQTASKKKVEVSKEALQKTKNIFKDIEESDLKEPTSFKGFQTANKKEVVVSKEAIAKTKGLFNDIEMSESKEHTFKGFQTASNKKVNVSEQAIAKSKKIFQDIDANTHDEDNNKKSDNNTVKESEKSLFSNQNTNVSDKLRMINDCNAAKKSIDDIIQDKNKSELQKDGKLNTEVNLGNILNTQVLNNFDQSLCTEDFKETPRNNKRSGSPILSCPRAKKRKKFETPYKDEKNKITKNDDKKTEYIDTCRTEIKFNDNYKKNKVHKLTDLNLNNGKRTVIDPYITNFSLENILNYEFESHRNELTYTKINIEELKRFFISAVNKNLIPEGWLDNHIKLILWKLISYEIKIQNGGLFCTVQNTIDQLKYRYDKELYNAERSALRKVFEKDDVPSKTMVLCVAGIFVDGVSVSSATNTKEVELLLTDGWYFIKCTIDKMLSKLVYDSRILVGSKIVTSGAELVNCQGMSPWEDTSAVRLKIYGNSTRPAPWHSKLGYVRGAILSSLSTVKVDGGNVSRLRVYVTRVYPMLFVEKFEDGSTVTRSERLEHLHQMKYEAERELMMERIYEDVQKEFSEQESQDSEILESGKRKYYDSGSQIAKMMKISKDPMEFRAHLTTSQVQLLQDHTCKYREKLLQAIENRLQDQIHRRNVVSLARGRIATTDKNKMAVTKGMLSIWKPNEAILELFKEGSWIEVMNTVPTAMRYSEIQITAGRQSVFRPTKSKGEITQLQSLKRICYKISDVTNNPTMTTDYNEIDTVGMVFLIEPSYREFESNRNFQNAYITDADKNIICVNFWGGVKKFGFENILDTGQIVACANLLKRAGNTRKNIPQFRVTEFTHFTKTPKNLQAREIVDDLNKKLFGLDRRKFCDDCIAIKNNYTAIKCFNNSENESPYRFNKSDYSIARNKMFIDTPQGLKPNRNDDMNLNLTGLDFESSFKHETQELSPKTMLRKKKVNEKIAKLKMYGEPPPLTAISIINKSANAKKSYQSPLLSVKSVATVDNLPQESPKTRDTSRERSPVLSVKRTYVRSVPVKLNFVEDKSVDHFAEEFDASPPLSLD